MAGVFSAKLIASFAVGVLTLGGCAVMPGTSSSDLNSAHVAKRDVLAEAVEQVEIAPWPKPQAKSFLSFISGPTDPSLNSHSESVDLYVSQLSSRGPGFLQLTYDASMNLATAERLARVATKSLDASRRSMGDVALIETAIQALRTNWQIYSASADALENDGEVIDDHELDALQDDYRRAIRGLGKIADQLAEDVERDRSKQFAVQEGITGL